MIHTLSPLVLPASAGFRRDLPARAENPDNPGWERYDRDTLIYDAVHLPHRGFVRLYLPRTLNLWPLLEEAEVAIDGRRAPAPRRRRFRRHETLDFETATSAPAEIRVRSGRLGEHRLEVATGDRSAFAGRRVLYTMTRDGDLDWVRDWMTFHRDEHGADAALVTDNGSTAWTSAELLDAMRSVPGFRSVAVLHVPLPWGPSQFEKGVDDGKFLQTALLNLVRDRFLHDAEAVLNTDVDELVLKLGEMSVFDAARRWGYATFWGHWHYAPPGAVPASHRDHAFYDPAEKRCPTKYVYRPQSFLGQGCLSVHSLEKVNRRLFATRSFRFIHCRGISTSWKYDRAIAIRSGLAEDHAAAEALGRVFGRG